MKILGHVLAALSIFRLSDLLSTANDELSLIVGTAVHCNDEDFCMSQQRYTVKTSESFLYHSWLTLPHWPMFSSPWDFRTRAG